MNNDFIKLELNYLDYLIGEITLFSNGKKNLTLTNTDKFKETYDSYIAISLLELLLEKFTVQDYKSLHSDLQQKLLYGLLPWDDLAIQSISKYLFSYNEKFNLIDNSYIANFKNFRLSIYLSKMVFIINGSGGIGKDEFIKCIMRRTHVDNISSIDPVKRIYSSIEGYTHIDIADKNEINRKLLADTKHLFDERFDFTENYVLDKLDDFLNHRCLNIKNYSDEPVSDIAFVHIREPENIAKIVNKISVYTILMKSDRVNSITSNSADANVEEYNYDMVISNNGTIDDLDNIANSFVNGCTKKSFTIPFIK